MRRILSLVLLWGLCSHGHSAAPTSLDHVASLADDLTVAVARLDLSQLNVDAVFQTLTNLTSDEKGLLLPPAAIASRKAPVKDWLARFSAAGGREVYVLFSLTDLGVDFPVMVAVPIGDGSNREALRDLLIASGLGAGGKCAVVNQCVVAAPASILRRLETAHGRPPKDFPAAFAQARPGVLQAVFVPYAMAGRVVEELMPVLPSVLGGGSSAALSHGLRWAILSASSPPELSVQLVVQERTGGDADALRRTIQAALDQVGKMEPVRQLLPQWEALAAALKPSVEGDRLVLTWDRSRIEKLFKTTLLTTLVSAYQQAETTRTLNHMKQIGLAILMYANDHQDQFPAHLAATLPYLANGDVLLLPGSAAHSPSELMKWEYKKQVEWIDQHGAYTYRKPAATLKEVKDPANTLMAHQRLETTGGAAVPAVFADGHAQRLDRETFDKLLKP